MGAKLHTISLEASQCKGELSHEGQNLHQSASIINDSKEVLL